MTLRELYFKIRQEKIDAGWSEHQANMYVSKWTWKEWKTENH